MQIPGISALIYGYQTFSRYAGGRLGAMLLAFLAFAIIESVSWGALMPLLSLLMQQGEPTGISAWMLDAIAHAGFPPTLNGLLLCLAILFVLKGTLLYGVKAYRSMLVMQINYRLRAQLTDRILQTPYKHYLTVDQGYLARVLMQGTKDIMISLHNYCEAILHIFCLFCFSICLAAIDYPVMIALVVVVTLMVLPFRRLHSRYRKAVHAALDCNGRIQSETLQIMGNSRYLRCTGREETIGAYLKKRFEELRARELRMPLINDVTVSFQEPLVVVTLCALIYFQLQVRGIAFDLLMVQFIFIERAARSAMRLLGPWNKFAGMLGAVQIYEKQCAELPAPDTPPASGRPPAFARAIRFENVSFSYEDGTPVLNGISLEISRNQTIALVGSSGSGKSTVLDMLTGVLPPDSGRILLDDTDYQSVDLQALRAQIGYVTQPPLLLDQPVANNIASVFGELTDEEMSRAQRAAAAAHCTEFVEALPQKMATPVGERGGKLSGGQCQRVVIARELYREPQILLFDEATSALDSASERHIQESLRSLAGSRTIVLVSHRLSAIRHADRIYVLEEGRVIQEGTHEALMQDSNGRYAALVRQQEQPHDSQS